MLWHQSVDMRNRLVFDPRLHVRLPVDVQLLQMYKFGIFAEKSQKLNRTTTELCRLVEFLVFNPAFGRHRR